MQRLAIRKNEQFSSKMVPFYIEAEGMFKWFYQHCCEQSSRSEKKLKLDFFEVPELALHQQDIRFNEVALNCEFTWVRLNSWVKTLWADLLWWIIPGLNLRNPAKIRQIWGIKTQKMSEPILPHPLAHQGNVEKKTWKKSWFVQQLPWCANG